MINIDIIQNEEFSIGYPYNSPIDSYFRSLSQEYIEDYSISSDELLKISNHKIATEEFDASLYVYAKSLSSFVQDYEIINETIISVYDEQMNRYNDLLLEQTKLVDDRSILEDEFYYMNENRTKLDLDLIQATELVDYYQSQLMTNTIVDIGSYIDSINSDIVIIDDSLALIINAIPHYEGILSTTLIEYIDSIQLIKDPSYEDVILKVSFELWQTRTEDYYQKLVAYYQVKYDNAWVGGQSLMYDKNKEYIDNYKLVLDTQAAKLSGEKIKEIKFEIEKKVKLYMISIVNEDIDPHELQNKKIEKELEYYAEAINLLNTDLTDAQFAIDSVISYSDFQDYNKYKELIQLEKHYIATNINAISQGLTDNLDLDQYKSLILEVEDTYMVVNGKLLGTTYWTNFYSHLVVDNILKEIEHTEDILALTRKGVINEDLDIEFIENKIVFYTSMKEDILLQISVLVNTSDSKIIEKMELNDQITLLNSNLFATLNAVDESILNYENSFNTRLNFYIKDETMNTHEGISEITANGITTQLTSELESLKLYNSNLVWWDKDEKEKLFNMYDSILNTITGVLSKQWDIEFNHIINRSIKIDFYKGYLEDSIKLMYATMVQFTNYNVYMVDMIPATKIFILNIEAILDDYVSLSILSEENISIPTTFYDYSQIREFEITKDSNKEDIITTILGYLNNNYVYISELNLSFKTDIFNADEELKINTMWDRMEQQYD